MSDEQAKCPKCEARGGVIARKDAYVNYAISKDGSVDWNDTSDVTQFDNTVYECVTCGQELTEEEICEANGFQIGDIVHGTYVSEWDNGTTVRSPCKYDPINKRCFDIQMSDTDVGNAKLLEEYVETEKDSHHEMDGVTFDY